MDYEKKYKEALERANELRYVSNKDSLQCKTAEHIFPELKDSEDEVIRKEIVRFIQMEIDDEIVGNKWIAWLEKKDEQKPIEWSEKDKHILNNIYNFVAENLLDKNRGVCADECLKWLNLLKDRVQSQNTITDEELAQAKKDAYNDALDKIEYHSGEPTFDDGWSAAIWYLKKRNTQPQSQWKPSNEQITWLYRAADDASKNSRMKQVLNELLSDLKKLKG